VARGIVVASSSYERRLVALPKADWKVGDPPEEWAHGFVPEGYVVPPRCGVWISEGVRCKRFEDHPIHHFENPHG
jgi:hypothetical protein